MCNTNPRKWNLLPMDLPDFSIFFTLPEDVSPYIIPKGMKVEIRIMETYRLMQLI